jgi:2-dehydro-3-deoxyphosphooctonate aldolase (KDO 8-P synthase)
MAPWDMANAVEKVRSTGNRQVLVTERGTSFGYNNLVADMRAFPILARTGCPVIFDVTHSVQLPGGQGNTSGGQPEFIEPLARAGCAAGVNGIFLEVHDRPAKAKSDGSNALALEQLPALLAKLNAIGKLVRSWPPVKAR